MLHDFVQTVILVNDICIMLIIRFTWVLTTEYKLIEIMKCVLRHTNC